MLRETLLHSALSAMALDGAVNFGSRTREEAYLCGSAMRHYN